MTKSLPAPHPWKVHRIGGLDQVIVATGDDLLALSTLDQKLWVALSCPAQGLELDDRTLAFIDQDNDGRIRVPDILKTIEWAAARLNDVGELLAENEHLPLAALKEPEVKAVAERLAATAGERGNLPLAVAEANERTFAARPLNGDGVVNAGSTTDATLQRLIADIAACVGTVGDRSGGVGIDRAKVEQFYAAAQAYVTWSEKGAAVRDPVTAQAAAAINSVRAKVDDFFARVRLASFDPRAAEALEGGPDPYSVFAARELTTGSPEIAALPIAHVRARGSMPLGDGVNPAWAGALRTLQQAAVSPLFGEDRREISEDDWAMMKTRIAPYEAWQAAKVGAEVEALGLPRLQQLLAGPEREALLQLIAQDEAVAPEYGAIQTLGHLARLRRDFATLLRNFVNFIDFYSPDRWATFQTGVLYLDSRSSEMCVDVADSGAHAKIAALSYTYLAYCDLKRKGEPPRRIAAAMTQGHGDYLRVGRNGVFYDRKGRDWDATITLIIENPISIRQAFWSPYKRVARFVEDQMTKFAAAKEKSADEGLAGGLAAATTRPAGAGAAAKPAFDIARFAGIFAAIGLAIGAIGGALAAVATGFMNLVWWQMPLAVFGALLIISGPSMLLAALKLRQRTIGPILDANGWAINGRVHVSIPFGTRLTERALLPPGANRRYDDPYADNGPRRRRNLVIALIVLLLAAALAARTLGTWPFDRPMPTEQAPPPPDTAQGGDAEAPGRIAHAR